MRTSTIQEIKQELLELPAKQLIECCLRLSKYKKENKELMTYLLFESHDEAGYISGVKSEMSGLFEEINKSNLYFAKKTIRKILRIANKYIRYAGSRTVEAELLLHFCQLVAVCGLDWQNSTVILNMYRKQITKIRAALESMHEDLQYDYQRELDQLI
jgi:hypothetical protein